MPRKKTDQASITGAETDEWYTAGDAAKVLTGNSGKEISPDYMSKLGRMGKLRTRKLSVRVALYYKPDVDTYKVEPRGKRSGDAKRVGKTGPTVREQRAAKKGENDAA